MCVSSQRLSASRPRASPPALGSSIGVVRDSQIMETCEETKCRSNLEDSASELAAGLSSVGHTAIKRLDVNSDAGIEAASQLNINCSNSGNDDALQTLTAESPANNFTSLSQNQSEHFVAEEKEVMGPMLCNSFSADKQLRCSESGQPATDPCNPVSLASVGQSLPGMLTTQSGESGALCHGLAPATRDICQDTHSSCPMENVICNQKKSPLHLSSEAADHVAHSESTLANVAQPCLPKDQFLGRTRGRPRGRGCRGRGGRRGRGRGRGTQSSYTRDTDTNTSPEHAVQSVQKQDEERAAIDVAERVHIKQPKCKKKATMKAECPIEITSLSAEDGRPKRKAAVMAKKFLHDLLLVEGSQQDASASEVPNGNLDKKQSSHKHAALLEGGENADNFTDDSRDEDFVPYAEDGTYGSMAELYSDGDSWDEESKDSDMRSASERPRRASRSLLPCDTTSFFHEAEKRTRDHRQIHHSDVVYPQWVPLTTDWTLLYESESVKYLPKERNSPLFEIRREAFPEESQMHQLQRFEALTLDSRTWDVNFFAGGPVWSMDWCPTPSGSTSNQFVALYANTSALDLHKLNQVHREPALLQVWNLGPLQSTKRSRFHPVLAYGVALDFGCIWDMKFCPSGSWGDPTAPVKVPQMTRMGLLAAAFSDGKVRVFSLPHANRRPQTQLAHAEGSENADQKIYKVKAVVTLEVGAVHCHTSSTNGSCFCLDWSPTKGHSHLAVGFYDGSVGLWDLTTKSSLLRVKKPDGNITLYPYNTFIAHDNIVKSLAWCPMNKNFLATASHDRWIKFWDVRRTEEPRSAVRRYQNTEVAWLLHSCGVVVAQENCYAAYGVNGVHYLDYGFLGYKPYLFNPRVGTIWSVSGSDWLNAVFSGESTGEVIGAILPNFWKNPHNIKHPYYSRFPVYATELKEIRFNEDDHQEEAGPATSTLHEPGVHAAATDGKLSKYTVVFHDTDLTCFDDTNNREPFEKMNITSNNHATLEAKLPITGIHKVRINPNLDAHVWILSAGFSGIVRAHNVFAMNTVMTDTSNEACTKKDSESTK